MWRTAAPPVGMAPAPVVFEAPPHLCSAPHPAPHPHPSPPPPHLRPSPAAGEPAGDDDFEKYKIHIKVKWRDGEQLHVLGEAAGS